MAEPADPDEEWPCPGFAPHPPGQAESLMVSLDWREEVRSIHHRADRQRVIDYTCSCRETSYELLGVGGRYQFRRIHRSNPKVVAYAGPWQRIKAKELWRLLLRGEAR